MAALGKGSRLLSFINARVRVTVADT